MTMLFVSAFLLGLIFNATPGAVFAETVKQGVHGGFRPALAVQIGSLVGDALWAVLGLVGIGLLLQLDALRLPIGIAGVAYLLWLARDAWRAAGREFSLELGGEAQRQRALKSGVMLSVTNPQNVAYWAALGSAMGAVGVAAPTSADYGVFFAGFMASSILWCFVCAAIVDRVFKRAGLRWARVTYKLCALAFLALALGSVRDLAQEALRKPVREKPVVVTRP
ncbi:LysE family translocator [Rhizobacter sp. J219]|uniref:LysE family translocator n=1 Tax=Rhizobacter sp. J219 TaxID=2898430 RepID=UPI002151DF6F|nr:LysE family translocator [Rhizobacter sp. J219]MCR5884655.1 LysE family translocator [Rhizobacter sp. J219]